MPMDARQLPLLVNRLVDAFYPDPDDPDPVGPWGPWIREALKHLRGPGPLPDPWEGGWRLAATDDNHWWQDYHPGPRPWRLHFADLAALNPQPLPPVDGGLALARGLATVALRRATAAGGEQGGQMLRAFVDDWCGTMWRFRIPRWIGRPPGEPRPPRPEESLVLGAALIRASAFAEFAPLRKAGEEAGKKIFEHGMQGLG